ncbi:MAG: hypothetical protein ACTSUF_02045 [Candidatus Heimdallarchaeaceae archaeon]
MTSQNILHKIFFVYSALCIVIMLAPLSALRTTANPIYTYGAQLGGVYPNGSFLEMQKADVLFNIHTSRDGRTFNINYSGNYTLFNPNDTDVSVQIFNPIDASNEPISNSSDIQVYLNGTPIEFCVLDSVNYIVERNVSVYIVRYYRYQYIVCNITIPAKSHVMLQFVLKDHSFVFHYNEADVYFTYVVSSANAWAGNITETVTFIVRGKQPNDFADFDNKTFFHHCIKIKLASKTFQFQWQWINEQIKEDTVYIMYSFRYNDFLGLAIVIFFMFMILPPLIILIVIFVSAKTALKERKMTRKRRILVKRKVLVKKRE